MKKGTVFLIGAGPGDPGLLTLKGRDCLARADVIVYDALIDPSLLELARTAALRVYVGKRGAQHAKEQSEINDLLVRHAERGRHVARLKGGDPFLFGRGSEEALHLHERHIPFEIVPGVSSASGAAAYAGIPLTDRRLASMVTLVTGHEGHGKATVSVDWSRISRQSTLVIFMGMEQLAFITDRLRKHLWEESLPAALIQWGTWPRQRIIEGTLGDIAQKADAAQLTAPVLAIFGKVVGMRKKLRWFETRPLFGKRIVITRAAEQAAEFRDVLAQAGAEVLSFPTIQILPPRSWDIVDQALEELGRYDWLLFTSGNGVQAFFERLRTGGRDIRDLKGLRIGAIGPKTSARLSALGLRVDAFPEEYRAEALADAVGAVGRMRVLVAGAQEARETLVTTLEARGAQVTVAPVYRTVKSRRLAGELKDRFLNHEIDLVTFTSSSTVDGFMLHFTPRERRKLFEHTRAAVIGPVTAGTLKDYGVRAAIRPPRYTTEALAKAIVAHFA